jgi:glutamyl-tRNA synthetase
MEYAAEGFLPEALFNFLALLGWSPGNDEEIMSKDRIVEAFNLSGIGKANAVFDQEKLRWMNGVYMRDLARDDVIHRVLNFMPSKGISPEQYDSKWLKGIISLVIERARTFSELIDQLHYFLHDDFAYEEKGVQKISKKGNVVDYLQITRDVLTGVDDFSRESLEDAMRQIVEEKQIGFGKIAQPVRLALTGGLASPGLFDVLHFLGRERALKRIDRAISFFKKKQN